MNNRVNAIINKQQTKIKMRTKKTGARQSPMAPMINGRNENGKGENAPVFTLEDKVKIAQIDWVHFTYSKLFFEKINHPGVNESGQKRLEMIQADPGLSRQFNDALLLDIWATIFNPEERPFCLELFAASMVELFVPDKNWPFTALKKVSVEEYR